MLSWSEPREEIEIAIYKIITMILNFGKSEPQHSYKHGLYKKRKCTQTKSFAGSSLSAETKALTTDQPIDERRDTSSYIWSCSGMINTQMNEWLVDWLNDFWVDWLNEEGFIALLFL